MEMAYLRSDPSNLPLHLCSVGGLEEQARCPTPRAASSPGRCSHGPTGAQRVAESEEQMQPENGHFSTPATDCEEERSSPSRKELSEASPTAACSVPIHR